MIPRWDEARQVWELELDADRWKTRRKAAQSSPNTTEPYVVNPLRAADPRVARPLVFHAIANVFVGGSTRLVVDLLEGLHHRYDQEVMTSALWPGGAHQGMLVHHFPTAGGPEPVSSLLALRKPKLVHMHYWGERDEAWYRMVMSAAEAVPCRIIENINTPVAPLRHPRVDHYVYVSEYVRNEFGGSDTERSSVIYPGSDASLFEAPPAEPDAENAIGMVYRLEDDKLREDSIQLFIEVVRRRPRTKVYIIGGGSYFSSYVAQTRAAGVRQNFHFAGYVPYPTLPRWYAKFATFVSPVWKESFGQVSVFAMMRGMAVAGFDVGALSEILNGHETLAGDRASAAETIAALLDDPELLRRLGAANRRRAEELFAVTEMVAGYRELYDRLTAPDLERRH